MPDPTFKQELADAAQRIAQLSAELDELSFRIAGLEHRRAEAEADAKVPWAEPTEITEVTSPPPPDPVVEPPSPPKVKPSIVPAAEREAPVASREADKSGVLERWSSTVLGSGYTGPDELAPRPESTAGATELVIGRIWLNRIGAAILFLAMAFFVQYSAEQGWIGPELRVSLAAFAGIALIVGGVVMLHRGMRPVAGGLVGCGIGIMYVAAFATYNLYHLVSSEMAFGLFVAVSVMSVALSVHSRMLPIAVLGLLGGYGTPILISTGANQQIALLTYVMLLDVGFLLVATFRRWDVLRTLSWLGTLLLFGGWYHTFYEASALWTTWAFLVGFYLLFHGSSLLSLRLGSFRGMSELTAVVWVNNAAFFGSTYFLWQDAYSDWLGLFAVVIGGLQWLAAWKIAPSSEETARGRLPFWIGGAAMLSLAAPLQFDRYLVSVSWCVQAVVTLAFCRRFTDPWLRAKGAGLLIAAAVHLLYFERQDPTLTPVLFSLGQWTVSWLTILLSLAGLSAYVSAAALTVARDPDEQDQHLASGLAIGGTAWLMWLFAVEWERYLASWWWLGLGTCWWLVSMRVAKARQLAVAITIALCVK
ncbi:MAG: DUF2339 domain-containing protein, partial [Planctomycetes bacterium]|nr:DUF2339 domain-containing protein [Planctomycetota bacterium]